MNTLTISAARSRMIRGETQYNALSRFVKEIPDELIEGRGGSGRKLSGDVSVQPGRVRPVAVSPKKRAEANKPFIAKAVAFTDLKKGSDMSAQAPDYGPGDRVAHMKFGEGTVLSVEKGARDYEVEVDFDSAGVKKMFAGFAKLRRL
jgi:DNA helicase-2/ATP-dependent DNA helicase PcrA